jgi:hypothetical protein
LRKCEPIFIDARFIVNGLRISGESLKTCVWRLRPLSHPDNWQTLCVLHFTSFCLLNNEEKIFHLNQKIYPTGTNPTIVTHIARQCSFCCFKWRIEMDLCGRIKWMNFLSISNVWSWGSLQTVPSVRSFL